MLAMLSSWNEEGRRGVQLFGLGLLLAGATSLFVFGNELGHAVGFGLSGFNPCIGPNSAWVAPPNTDVKTLLGGLGGPVISLMLGTAFAVAHFAPKTGKKWSFAFGCVNFVAHPLFPLLFIVNLLVSGKPMGGFDDEVMLALMLPATRSTTEILQQLATTVDRAFLLTWQSVLVVWPLVLLPGLGVLLLVWKGRLSRPNRIGLAAFVTLERVFDKSGMGKRYRWTSICR